MQPTSSSLRASPQPLLLIRDELQQPVVLLFAQLWRGLALLRWAGRQAGRQAAGSEGDSEGDGEAEVDTRAMPHTKQCPQLRWGSLNAREGEVSPPPGAPPEPRRTCPAPAGRLSLAPPPPPASHDSQPPAPAPLPAAAASAAALRFSRCSFR